MFTVVPSGGIQRKSIGDVAVIELRQPNIAQKLNRITKVEPIFIGRHNANAMLAEVH